MVSMKLFGIMMKLGMKAGYKEKIILKTWIRCGPFYPFMRAIMEEELFEPSALPEECFCLLHLERKSKRIRFLFFNSNLWKTMFTIPFEFQMYKLWKGDRL